MEIEIKARIKNLPKVREKLIKLGAKKIGDKHQLDIYLSPPDKSFFNQEKYYLRVRENKINNKSSLDYHIYNKTKDGYGFSEEKEVKVQDAGMLLKIFRELKFLEICRIDKQREVFKYKDFEIVLDKVENLGEFIEVELTGEPKDEEAFRQRNIEFLENLGIGKKQYVLKGYVEEMLST